MIDFWKTDSTIISIPMIEPSYIPNYDLIFINLHASGGWNLQGWPSTYPLYHSKPPRNPTNCPIMSPIKSRNVRRGMCGHAKLPTKFQIKKPSKRPTRSYQLQIIRQDTFSTFSTLARTFRHMSQQTWCALFQHSSIIGPRRCNIQSVLVGLFAADLVGEIIHNEK